MKKEIKKIVLAYSGGLDTSIMIPWLKDNYPGCEVIAVCGDVGQGKETEGLEEKALKTGASKLYIEDLREEFIQDYVYPTVKAWLQNMKIPTCWALPLPVLSSLNELWRLPRQRVQMLLPTVVPEREMTKFVLN